MVIENNLKNIRNSKRLSAQKLADALGVKILQVQRLEKGERKLTIEWAIRLAKVLECTPADILGYENLGIDSQPSQSQSPHPQELVKVKLLDSFLIKTLKEIPFTKESLKLLNLPDNTEVIQEKDKIIFYVNNKPIYELVKTIKPRFSSKAAVFPSDDNN